MAAFIITKKILSEVIKDARAEIVNVDGYNTLFLIIFVFEIEFSVFGNDPDAFA